MIQITPQMRVLVAVEPVELRRGIDGLAAAARDGLASDPFSCQGTPSLTAVAPTWDRTRPAGSNSSRIRF